MSNWAAEMGSWLPVFSAPLWGWCAGLQRLSLPRALACCPHSQSMCLHNMILEAAHISPPRMDESALPELRWTHRSSFSSPRGQKWGHLLCREDGSDWRGNGMRAFHGSQRHSHKQVLPLRVKEALFCSVLRCSLTIQPRQPLFQTSCLGLASASPSLRHHTGPGFRFYLQNSSSEPTRIWRLLSHCCSFCFPSTLPQPCLLGCSCNTAAQERSALWHLQRHLTFGLLFILSRHTSESHLFSQNSPISDT